MSNSVSTQPDTDAGFRHRAGSIPQGNVETTPPQPQVIPGDGKDPSVPHIFHMAKSETSVFEGGRVQGSNEENWPILQDQQCAVIVFRSNRAAYANRIGIRVHGK